VVKNSKCLLFADDVKIYREIKSPYDIWLLLLDTNNVRVWCTSTYMKIKSTKPETFLFVKKYTDMILISNCMNFLSHSRTLSRIWVCL